MASLEVRGGGLMIGYDLRSAMVSFAVSRLQEVLGGRKARTCAVKDLPVRGGIAILFGKEEAGATRVAELQPEGFKMMRGPGGRLFVLALDEAGAMYGVLDLAEQLRTVGLEGVREKVSNPKCEFRGVKFNLPWAAYRSGAAAEGQVQTCQDLGFWQKLLDMMAENRFNALTLWNLHPFVYMLRPTNFPKACPFSDGELAQWRALWRMLLKMAKERGVRTYVLNWNIVVPPEFTQAYGGQAGGDRSELVGRYTKECVTQMLDEYEDLTGFGISLGDWMGGMNVEEQEEWATKYLVAGVKAAKRPVEFIHRAPFTTSAVGPLRKTIDEAGLRGKVWVEVKFNWSHGHSTPKLVITHNDGEGGKVDEGAWKPEPTNYKVLWTVRNEDFFVLRWGEPGFIKQHIADNSRRCVGGYLIGAEGFIPGKDVSHKTMGAVGGHVKWQYAFEKQWMFWMLWGRLLYEPKTSEGVFEAGCEKRYGMGLGKKMFEAYRRASRMPLRLASFYRATWDYTLYAEMFAAPTEKTLISVRELMEHPTLDPRLLSVAEFVAGETEGKEVAKGLKTPLQVADELTEDGQATVVLVQGLRWRVTKQNLGLGCELDDLETWGELSLYFADKVRAAVALKRYQVRKAAEEQTQAVALLESAAAHWERIIALTSAHYQATPHANGEMMLWEKFREAVQKDVAFARGG